MRLFPTRRTPVRRGAALRPLLIATALLAAAPMARAQQSVNVIPPSARNVTLLGIPSATVAPRGLVFGSLAGSTRKASGAGGIDGSAALGFGLGDADATVGVQVTAFLTSLTDDFGDSGYLELKASRRISAGPHPTYVSVTAGHLGGWGQSSPVDPTGTVALTTFSQISRPSGAAFPTMFTLGAGTNVRNNQTDPGLFLGAGIGLTPSFGTSIAWTGETVDLGAGFRFDAVPNLGITATFNDVFNQEHKQGLTISLNYYIRNAFGG